MYESNDISRINGAGKISIIRFIFVGFDIFM